MIDAPDNGSHVTSVRVYYEDTDAAGIVYYANYLKFAERARSELMRDIGDGEYGRMVAAGMHFVVRRCVVDYLGAARLDDLLKVHSRMLELRGASIAAEQIVRRGGEDLVTMQVELACLGAGGRPARIPAGLRAALEKYAGTAAVS
ncbi:MAG: YbgC/FadM family acyl-CoA thioesterase [Alphaproteobacteria bacterium]|nr:YbgC/FadM family acyl-CoA thioesterase [Alphaproteobacteria bacterium]